MPRRLSMLAVPAVLPSAVLLGVSLLATACVSGASRSHAAGHQQAGRGGSARQPGARGPARMPERPGQALRIQVARFRLPAAVSGETVSARDGQLLVAGGLLADQSSSGTVVSIDTRTGRSVAAGQLKLPVHDAASAVLGGRLLVFGGGTGASYVTVQRPAPGGGIRYGALPASRSDLVAVAFRQTVYLAGGHGNSGYARSVLATSDGRHFRTVALLPVPVRYPGAAIGGGYLWVFGGLTPRGPTAAVQRVNLRTGRVRLDGRLPRPLEAGAAFTLNGVSYLAGGLTTGAERGRATGAPLSTSLVTSSAVWRFSPGGPSFSVAGRLQVPVSHAAVAVVHGTVYLAGGLDGTRTVRTITIIRLARGPAT